MMRWRIYILLVTLLMTGVGTLSAQRRLTAESEHHKKSVSSSSRTFTSRDRQAATDRKGLRQSLYVGDHHSFGLSLNTGYSTFLSKSSGLQSRPGGYSFGGHFVYEYQNGYLLVQTGVGAAWQKVTLRGNDYTMTKNNISDSWGMPIKTLNYRFTNRREVLTNAYVQVPVLVGGTYAGFYGLAGVKLNVALAGSSQVKTTATTTAFYDRYIGEWGEMDNHGYRKDVDLSESGGRVPFKIDLMVSAEAGYEWVMKETWRLRVAAFAEVGVVNINPKGNNSAVYVPEATKFDFATFRLHPSFGAQDFSASSVHNLFAGIRLTFLYTLIPEDKCILCSHNRRSKHWH